MLLEGMSLPIPSEVIAPLIGYFSSKGIIDFNLGIVIATLGSLTGSLIDYFIALKLGRPFLIKYGKYFKLKPSTLSSIEKWFEVYGIYAVLLFRFVPGFRALISFPAGLAKMSLFKFIPITFIGHLSWDYILGYLGIIFSQNIEYIINSIENYFHFIIIIVIIIIIAYFGLSLVRNKGR
jgi:membrane protein DedA with SNARE-associated domain